MLLATVQQPLLFMACHVCNFKIFTAMYFCWLQLRRQDGKDYARSAYISMMMGVLRHINASYLARRLNKDPTTPADIKLESDLCSALRHNMDATCRDLHKKGKGVAKQQELFTPEEFNAVIQFIQKLPQTAYKHLLTGYISLAFSIGGRVSDYPKFMRR